MDKLPLIIKREYLAKVRNRSFIVMTVLSPLLVVGMAALVFFLTKANNEERKVIAVLDEGNFFREQFKDDASIAFVPFRDISLETAKDSAQHAAYYGLLYIPEGRDIENAAENIEFFCKESPGLGTLSSMEGVIRSRVRDVKLRNFGVPDEVLGEMGRNYEINVENFTGEKKLRGINEMKAVIGGAFGYLIMMFIIIYGAFVMRSVIEEKTSRIIEVIISSVKPFQLMLGKIIGTSLAGITQFVIWIISAGLLLFVLAAFLGISMGELGGSRIPPDAADAMNNMSGGMQEKMQLYIAELLNISWGVLLFSFVVYFILGYLIYSSIYAAIGAAVDNETDTQQFMFPVILPLMLAIYVGFFSVFNNPHGPIAVAFSLFPLTSPIVMLMRLPGGIGTGGVPVWQFVTSIVLLVVTFLAIVWLAAKIYRVGILMYGKKPGYKELYKWLKYS
ncbi:ABC transporter permease [Sinomicrobium pectinilyticum]|uniref:ABC transporter permease n=1 Tax=Sinomicrobium pectinilyticum TaxID=1084421 RepID=A0A3N0E4G6_SINP1|nr:ABC transporter permease [Sinomicrobium pectinilyticum]RNL82742.1 ABC transporter permease [Sinomicrobium pectinilyticum]